MRSSTHIIQLISKEEKNPQKNGIFGYIPIPVPHAGQDKDEFISIVSENFAESFTEFCRQASQHDYRKVTLYIPGKNEEEKTQVQPYVSSIKKGLLSADKHPDIEVSFMPVIQALPESGVVSHQQTTNFLTTIKHQLNNGEIVLFFATSNKVNLYEIENENAKIFSPAQNTLIQIELCRLQLTEQYGAKELKIGFEVKRYFSDAFRMLTFMSGLTRKLQALFADRPLPDGIQPKPKINFYPAFDRDSGIKTDHEGEAYFDLSGYSPLVLLGQACGILSSRQLDAPLFKLNQSYHPQLCYILLTLRMLELVITSHEHYLEKLNVYISSKEYEEILEFFKYFQDQPDSNEKMIFIVNHAIEKIAESVCNYQPASPETPFELHETIAKLLPEERRLEFSVLLEVCKNLNYLCPLLMRIEPDEVGHAKKARLPTLIFTVFEFFKSFPVDYPSRTLVERLVFRCRPCQKFQLEIKNSLKHAENKTDSDRRKKEDATLLQALQAFDLTELANSKDIEKAKDAIKKAYRKKAKLIHPDKVAERSQHLPDAERKALIKKADQEFQLFSNHHQVLTSWIEHDMPTLAVIEQNPNVDAVLDHLFKKAKNNFLLLLQNPKKSIDEDLLATLLQSCAEISFARQITEEVDEENFYLHFKFIQLRDFCHAYLTEAKDETLSQLMLTERCLTLAKMILNQHSNAKNLQELTKLIRLLQTKVSRRSPQISIFADTESKTVSVRRAVILDADGVITGRQGIKTLCSELFVSCLGEFKSPPGFREDPQGYINKHPDYANQYAYESIPFKPLEEVISILKTGLQKDKNKDMRLVKGAKELMENLVADNNTQLIIITQNRVEYLQALFIVEGMSKEVIAKIKFSDINDSIPQELQKMYGDKGACIVKTLKPCDVVVAVEDDTDSLESMKKALSALRKQYHFLAKTMRDDPGHVSMTDIQKILDDLTLEFLASHKESARSIRQAFPSRES